MTSVHEISTRRACRWVAASILTIGMAACGTAMAQPAAAPASAAGSPIPLELNKLENITPGGPGCRVYFLVSNPDADPFEQFRLDLILFGNDGVIARRVALDLGPLPAKKQAVRLFDLQGLPCDDVGKVLINDVISCTHKPGGTSTDPERAACLDRMALTSRAKAPLSK